MMVINRSDLLDLVYRFYPRGVHNFERRHVPPNEPFYDDTEEHRRLVEAANRGRAEYPTWEAMIHRMYERYSLQNESLSLVAGGSDPAYSARIYRPQDSGPVPSLSDRASLSFHVSLLGPYYGIHDTGEPDEIPAAVAEEIEATYPGYQTIPPELGNEVVPDVAMDGALMGEATIYMCLFSKVWTWVDP
ncbi:hypothetical protein WME99_18775 [Sorangium sp. So ce136]|uniref:Uncharacterized protein n=1 Tax=Sorangium cellulosum TaxID=56 RepID=A0A4P2QWZ9_SORCE|nr:MULTISPECIES: hypothetical protein [Sorangium]AUX35019.1 hypothetical protein SOCE836_072070 [Sorangium cellulosum]WCQ94325.1 hypothetical protein NQZ70_07090 [Sorangium sp. Soce836]